MCGNTATMRGRDFGSVVALLSGASLLDIRTHRCSAFRCVVALLAGASLLCFRVPRCFAFGCIAVSLEIPWGPLGDLLEASWRPLGSILEASWALLSVLGHFCPHQTQFGTSWQALLSAQSPLRRTKWAPKGRRKSSQKVAWASKITFQRVFLDVQLDARFSIEFSSIFYNKIDPKFLLVRYFFRLKIRDKVQHCLHRFGKWISILITFLYTAS